MPAIISVGNAVPHHVISQSRALEFARELFSDSFKDIERLLPAFQNGNIEKRHLVKPLDWYKQEHNFKEKNDTYIEAAVELGTEAIQNCLEDSIFLKRSVALKEIDVFILISSTGIATPSLDARIMNVLPFSPHTKRIPLWGLGCAGGASGLSRAYEYCQAYPHAKVIVLSVELCSLTFQPNDRSKSNLIGTSLFADGTACALVCGDGVDIASLSNLDATPRIKASRSTLMPQSLDVMGWYVKDTGLFVIFSKDIPTIVEEWLKPNINEFLTLEGIEWTDIKHFIAHPGGKKVLEAYAQSLQLPPAQVKIPFQILKEYGNMSSATILFVLKEMLAVAGKGEVGLATALGPGFSSELLLMRWE